MVYICKKVIATVRKFENENDMTGLLKRIEKLYSLNIRHFRFNLSKLNRIKMFEDTFEAIFQIKSHYSDIGIMLDIGFPGAPIRINLPQGEKERLIQQGEEFHFVSSAFNGEKSNKSIALFADDLSTLFKENHIVYYADGEGKFQVKQIINKDKVLLISLDSIKIRTNQSIKCGAFIKRSEVDSLIRSFFSTLQPDMVALSLVDTPEDILAFKKICALTNTRVVSKIETAGSLLNLNKIINESDAIMVARGDLAFSTDLSRLLFYQNKIIYEAKKQKKDVYVATDILSSYSQKAFPLRSDVTDLASIISQNVSGIILNGPLVVSNNISCALDLIERMFENHNEGMLV